MTNPSPPLPGKAPDQAPSPPAPAPPPPPDTGPEPKPPGLPADPDPQPRPEEQANGMMGEGGDNAAPAGGMIGEG